MENKLFYCYSKRLLNFAKDNGIQYICQGINNKTNKKYWVYERNEILKNILDEFNKLKQESIKQH